LSTELDAQRLRTKQQNADLVPSIFQAIYVSYKGWKSSAEMLAR